MRILHWDRKKEEMKISIENMDDLWHLYNILEVDDMVFAVTYRREEEIADKIRPEKRKKKKMKLGIRVSHVGFQEFSDRLRIHGVIEQGPQDIGSHHTLNISTHDRIKIVKRWKYYQIDQVKETVKETRRPLIVFLSLDYDEATIAIMRGYGIQLIATITSHISGKQFKGKDKKNEYYGQILSKIKQYNLPIVVLGPGFAKEEFHSFCMEKNVTFKDLSTIGVGHAGMLGIYEALKRGLGKKILQDSRIAQEAKTVESLLEEISKNGNFEYGFEDVENALNLGAVKKLLVTDELVRSKKADKILNLAKKTSSKYMIVSTVHEAGKKLRALGGVGAILRYKIS